MADTNCYAMVRGSVIRLTRLDRRGAVVLGPRSSVVSRNVTRVTIDEVTDTRPGMKEKTPTEEMRLHIPEYAETIGFTTDIQFALTNPDALEIVTGQPVVKNAAGKIVGFDATTRLPAQAFALEVWSKLAPPSAEYRFGYTLFPFLMGGVLSGTTFANGVASFSVKGARTRRGAGWGRGPYTIYPPGTAGWDGYMWDEHPWDAAPNDEWDLRSPVGYNSHWTTLLTPAAPVPTETAQPLPVPTF